jgi:Calcineurin-like phosphoesterase
MKLQLLSDLHLETEAFEPLAAPGAEVLVLAGDIDSTWRGLRRFANWPVPVVYVPGNHEFDGRDIDEALADLRVLCRELRITLLERDSHVLTGQDGRRIRFVGTTRWSDFDLFGEAQRARCMRAASYFVKVMKASRRGAIFDPEQVREEALQSRAWLAETLALPSRPMAEAHEVPHACWHATVAITHYGPSLLSGDPRYGQQPGTASFCNADDDLLPLADLWLHGHLHCRHDYTVAHAHGHTRVVSNARGHARKGEADGHDGRLCVSV